MDGSKCILQVRGVRPFLSAKYDIEKHHNYRYLADADPGKSFNIVEHVRVFKENKAKLLAGLNRRDTKHVIIEINEEDSKAENLPAPENTPTSASISAETPATTGQEGTFQEPIKLKTEPAKPPVNQNETPADIRTENYEDGGDEDDTDSFDPDDTELV